MRKTFLATLVIPALAACGGGGEEQMQPVVPPPVPTVTATASAAPTATTPVEPPKPLVSMVDLQKKYFADDAAAWLARDAKRAVELLSAEGSMAMTGPGGWEEEKGREAMEKRMAGYFAAFPDIAIKYTRVILKGDDAVAEFVVTGTNSGEMMGEKPTGKKMGHRGAGWFTFDKDGKAKSVRLYMDMPTMLGHLGKHPDKTAKVRPVEALPTGETEFVIAKDGEDSSKNEASYKAYLEAMQKKDEKAMMALLTDDAVFADWSQPADLKTAKAIAKMGAGLGAAFPDMKGTTKACIGAGEWLACEGEWSGTFKGAMGPIKPTNKSGTVHYLWVMKFKDGKVAWTNAYSNGLEFAGQFGLLKGPKPGDKAADKGGDKKPADKGADKKPADKGADKKPADKPKDAPKK
jgi:predicted ester cyclase